MMDGSGCRWSPVGSWCAGYRKAGGDPEETQQSLQEAGQIMLDPNLWDFEVALRPMDSAFGLS